MQMGKKIPRGSQTLNKVAGYKILPKCVTTRSKKTCSLGRNPECVCPCLSGSGQPPGDEAAYGQTSGEDDKAEADRAH